MKKYMLFVVNKDGIYNEDGEYYSKRYFVLKDDTEAIRKAIIELKYSNNKDIKWIGLYKIDARRNNGEFENEICSFRSFETKEGIIKYSIDI